MFLSTRQLVYLLIIIGDVSPDGNRSLLARRYLPLVHIPVKGAFPSSLPCRAFAHVFTTTIFSEFLPFFTACVMSTVYGGRHAVPHCLPLTYTVAMSATVPRSITTLSSLAGECFRLKVVS